MRSLTPFAVLLLLAPAHYVCVQAQVQVRQLRADPVDEQHYVCVQGQARVRQLRTEVESTRRELKEEHRALSERKKALDQDRRDLDNVNPPTIDYSRYNLCPNGHPWRTCDHDSLKKRWEAEQMAEYNQRKMDLRDRVAREMSAYLRDLGVFRTRLEDLQRKEDELENASNALARELTKLRELARAEVRQLNKQIEDLERRRDLTRRALRQLADRLPDLERSLEEWANLPPKAREEMYWSLAKHAGELAAGGAGLDLAVQKGKLKTQLHAQFTRLLTPRLMKDVEEKLMRVESREQLMKWFDRVMGAYWADEAMKSREAELIPHQHQLEAIAEFAKAFAPPGAKVGLAFGEGAVAIGWARLQNKIAQEQVDIFNQLSMDQLTEVNNYSKVMVKQTNQLQALRDRVRGLEAFER